MIQELPDNAEDGGCEHTASAYKQSLAVSWSIRSSKKVGTDKRCNLDRHHVGGQAKWALTVLDVLR